MTEIDDPVRGPGDDPDPRVLFANERTFLAWIRTALALVGGGIAASSVLKIDHVWLRAAVGVMPMLLGVGAAAMGYVRWRQSDRALRAREPLPTGNALGAVAATVAAAGLLAAAVTVIIAAFRS